MSVSLCKTYLHDAIVSDAIATTRVTKNSNILSQQTYVLHTYSKQNRFDNNTSFNTTNGHVSHLCKLDHVRYY